MGWAMGVVLSAIKWDWAWRALKPLRLAANHGCFHDPDPSIRYPRQAASGQYCRPRSAPTSDQSFFTRAPPAPRPRSMVAEALASQRRVARSGNLSAVLADHTRLIGVVIVGACRPGLYGGRSKTVVINLVGRVRGGWGVNERITTLRTRVGCRSRSPGGPDPRQNLIN